MAAALPKHQRAELESRAWDLAQRAWTQRRIARELGVSQPAVCGMLARVNSRVLKRLEADVALKKAEQTQILEHLLDEAVQAWDRSKTPRKRASKKTTSRQSGVAGPDGNPVAPNESSIQEATERDGDPAFIGLARDILADIRTIWGLDAPARVESRGILTVAEIAKNIEIKVASYEANESDEAAQLDGPGDGDRE